MHLVPETSSIPNPLTVQYLDGNADLFKVLATLPIPIVVHDTCENPKIRFVNESFTQAYGYTLADGSSVAEWALKCYPNAPYRAAVMGQWAAEIAARQATGHTVPPNEYRLVDKFGHKRHVRVGFGIHEDLVIVTFHDLTATRAAEAALEAERRATEQTAFALTENMPAGAYTMLLRPNALMAEFAFVSKQFLNILDLTQEEAVGDPMTAFSRVHPEDLPRWLQLNSRSFASRQPFSAEARIVAYGQTKWIRAESVPRMLDDGSVIWEGILVDINQLKETQDRLNSVLEASRAFIWTFNLDTQMIEFEKTSAAIHGHEPHLHLDSWMKTLHPGDAGHVVAMLAELKSGIAGRRGATYRRFYPDGSYRWMRIQAGISARDSTGRPVALSGVSFDVTTEMNERLQAQGQQAQLREDLQRAQQRDTVSQVASGLAHDLNNLMAVVAGTTESLATHADGQIWLEEGLQRIGRAIDMAGDLIKGLGDLARPEQPKQMLDLCRLLQDAVELLGDKRIEQHNLRLELPKHGPSVWCHPTELAQVILNLTINACDSGSEHHPATVSLTAHPAGTPPPSRAPDAGILPLDGAAIATFTVADTGRGISDTERLQLFRSNFATGGNSKIGLGLLIVSTILRANRAGIWVDSAPERGTTMTLAWPMVPPDATKSNFRRLTTSPLATANSANDLTGLRVLIVDDLLDVADVFAEMLEAAGAVASTVCDPEEAANVLSEAPDVWSVLVTDLHMDRMDGRALAQHARSLSPPVPVVLVTARPDILAGTPTPEFSAVLSKPVTAADLVAVVRDAVDRNRNDINT